MAAGATNYFFTVIWYDEKGHRHEGQYSGPDKADLQKDRKWLIAQNSRDKRIRKKHECSPIKPVIKNI